MLQRLPQDQRRSLVQSDPAVVYAEVHREDTDSEQESVDEVSSESYESESEVGWDSMQLKDRSLYDGVSD